MLNQFQIGILFIFLMTPTVSLAQQQSACGPGDLVVHDTDEATRQCRDAFCALPELDRFGTAFRFGEFRSHVIENQTVFRNFLQRCYSGIDGNDSGEPPLRDDTKSLIFETYGGLFQRLSSGMVLRCSAFRIAEQVIVTARHCIYDDLYSYPFPEQFVFRSIAAPLRDIPIIGEMTNEAATPRKEIANDFDDYWFLLTEKAAFNLSLINFRKDFPRQARILVSGINLLAYILEAGVDPDRWAEAFRFATVTGAQWLPWQNLPRDPPSEKAKAQCIYHKASSFGGMSGAPLIGEEHAADGSRVLFVFGMHLRTGVPDNTHLLDADCGSYPGFNVGLALPERVLKKVGSII
jgi:hypothetical protein